MPLSLAERVRERRNQRLIAAQQRREASETTNPPPAMDRKGSPPNTTDGNANGTTNNSNSSNNPLVTVLDIESNPSAAREWGFSSSSSLPNPTPDFGATTPQRERGARALISPLNLPGKPPASPTQRGYVGSAPSSPRGGYPPSPGSSRPMSTNRARNLYNSIPTPNSRSNHVITPNNSTSIPFLSTSSPSWEDNEGIIPAIQLPLRADRSVSSEVMPRPSHNAQSSFFSASGRNETRSVYSVTNLADDDNGPISRSMRRADVPMDERSVGNSSRRSVDEDDALELKPRPRPKMPTSVRLDNPNTLLPPSSADRARMSGTVLASSPSMQEDEVSSLGGVEDHLSSASRTSLARLTAAVRSNTPKGLVAEERALWETFQASMAASRKAALEEADPKLREKLKQQQEEQERSFRAIQRVLADVSEDRDRANSHLKESKLEQRKLQNMMEKLEEQVEELRDSQRQAKRDAVEKPKTPPAEDVPVGASDAQVSELNKKIKDLEAEKEQLTTEVDSKNKQVTKLKRHLNGKGEVIIEDSDGLKKELEGRTAALENAKMIIASLENASGSLASDTRSKLKAKDSEISSLKTEALHQQKKLDNLATQLKEVQREKAQITEDRMNDTARLAVWKASLREHLSELQSAAVILEATRDDPCAVDRFAQVIAEALETMQKTVDALDSGSSDDDDEEEIRYPGSRHDGSFPGTDMDSLASGRSATSRVSKDTAARELKQELEEKSAFVKKLEEELRKVKEEAQNSKLEAERVEQQRDTDTRTLYGEIQMLRIQCNSNMELLAKKERELAVLRDSLKVEDDDVGYISDDATDADDEDMDDAGASSANLSMANYDASQTEALAALLAHSRGSMESPMPAGQASDVDGLRCEVAQSRLEAERAQKELKIEKESLANAKMIISSLEKANKSMMEDLRSRLQESNSAIHSLLEKSMESEKTTRKLETELEALRKENEKLLQGKGDVQAGEEKKEEPAETQ